MNSEIYSFSEIMGKKMSITRAIESNIYKIISDNVLKLTRRYHLL
jgi:hypothetical protein